MTVQEIMKRPYTKVIQELNDESGHYFFGRILELDGCQSTGATLEEMLQSLDEAMEGYLELKLEYHQPIPAPKTVDDYSGKFVLRLPHSLHMRLAQEAEMEGVSLNQYALYKLAQ